jgi:hypothetical protein
MDENSTVPDMPRGKGVKQVGFSASKARRADYEEAADRMGLSTLPGKLAAWIRIAVEEKLQRDCPDLFKRGLK